MIRWIFGILILLVACATPTATPFPTSVPTTPIPTATIILPSPTTTRANTPTIVPVSTATLQRTSTRITTLTRTPTIPQSEWAVRTLLVAPGTPGRMYALLSDQPFSVIDAERMRFVFSDDFGATWNPFAGGLPAEPACVRDINLDYATRDALYASTCKGLYRWSGTAWQSVSSEDLGMVAIVYKQSNLLWATSFKDRSAPVIRSLDAGKSWQPAANGLNHFNGVANIGIDPRDSNVIYAIIAPKFAGSYLRRGSANGQWTTMPTPLNGSQIDTGMTIDGATGDLYVTVFNGRASRWDVWRTRNPNTPDVNGVKWESVYEFGAELWATMLASGWSPQGLALYVRLRDYNSSRSNVMPSLDGGQTWTTMTIR